MCFLSAVAIGAPRVLTDVLLFPPQVALDAVTCIWGIKVERTEMWVGNQPGRTT